MDSEMICAISAAALFSILLVAIDISHKSSFSRVALLNGPVFLYLAIVVIGNSFSTMLTSTVADDLLTNPLFAATTGEAYANLSPRCFLFAFIGVFGFEIILKQINVTFSDLGVLTIKDWISLAKKAAVARAVKAGVLEHERNVQIVAQRLTDLSEEEINAHVIDSMGQEQLARLDAAADAGNADRKRVKALALAKKDFTVASAIPV
uniref:Uncharacterized protein n=1 Tax=Candidatus Kentrum sp. FW TaxID=2126338 RepID=A0A450T898_9GAMM|nr:MAG: hypothetical protein BECKFW1821C_GA0114237_100330 [Candidatus Kentron sp. FW]